MYCVAAEDDTMKRILVITVLAVLLLSTVGATMATAKDNQPAGKSKIYQYSKQIDPAGQGKLVINEKTLTYTFEGKGCTAGETYYLYYMDGATRVDLGWAPADTYGNVRITGSYESGISREQFAAAQVTKTPAITLKQANNLVGGPGYGTGPDGVVTLLFTDGRLIGPDGEPIPDATIEVYLADRVTPLTVDGSTTPLTITTGATGFWWTGYAPISHYGWRGLSQPPDILNYVAFYFPGNDQYSAAWGVLPY